MSIIYGDFGNKKNSLKEKLNTALTQVPGADAEDSNQTFLLIVDTGTEFKILSDEVMFDRKKQTANSNQNSKFVSDGTKIISEGFKLIEKGDIILFNGKTSVLLTQWNILY